MRLEHLSGEEREGKRRSPVGVVVGRRLLRMGRGRLGMGGEGGRIEGRAKGRLRAQSVREVSYGRMGARGADRPREALRIRMRWGMGSAVGDIVETREMKIDRAVKGTTTCRENR